MHKSAAMEMSRKAKKLFEASSIRRLSIEPRLLAGWGDYGPAVEQAAKAVISRLSTWLDPSDADPAAEMLRFMDSRRRGLSVSKLAPEETARRLAYIDFCRVGLLKGKLPQKESQEIANFFDSPKRRKSA